MPKTKKQSERARREAARIRMRQHSAERSEEALERNRQSHARRRQDDNYRSQERGLDAERRSRRRQDAQYREAEQQRDTQAHAVMRSDPIYRESEQQRNSQAHAVMRSNPDYRAEEQTRDALAHRVMRSDPIYHEAEQQRNTQAHAVMRSDPEYRAEEQTRDALAHAVLRLDPEYRAEEQTRDALAHRFMRSDPIYHEAEQQRNTQEHAVRRSNAEYRESECQRDMLAHAQHRLDPVYHREEQMRNTSARRRTRQQLREALDLSREGRRERSRSHRVQGNQENATEVVSSNNFQRYRTAIKQGPTEVCVCCGGTWFASQIKKLKKEEIARKYSGIQINNIFFLAQQYFNQEDTYKFCNTCHRMVKEGKTPKICLAEGLDFPTVPDCLKDLTCLEERLISPRIPFMRIIALGYERQSALRGAVVNVPISVDQTVTALPRTFDNTHVIQVHLKRRLAYAHNFMTETIRPGKVMAALQHLLNTELYQKHAIQLSTDWLQRMSNETEVPFIADRSDEETVRRILERTTEQQPQQTIEEAQQIAEDAQDDNLNPGGQETLLENVPIENLPMEQIVMAPGEGHRPADVTADDDAEELSFPTIYCGLKRKSKATFSKIARSEIRRYDRRCARIDKLLWTYKFYELQRIKSSISICMRKRSGNERVTAANLMDEAFVNNLVQHDDGYRILKGLRSSPAHWEAEKKKAIAMIRQFGVPTFFITLSAAESRWMELIVILAHLVDNRDITEEEAINMETSEKNRLIRLDPVTCSRYFDFRFRQLYKVCKTDIFKDHPITHHYWRIEFQHRGSPHCHGMYWLQNAPVFNQQHLEDFSRVEDFIDKYISSDGQRADVAPFLPYQKHRHGRSCQREVRGRKFCRFNMPYPPMPRTEILLPLPENAENFSRHQENHGKIRDLLQKTLTEDEEERLNVFEHFLQHESINMGYEDYTLALRASIKKPHVFLKRRFSDRMLNAYNPTMLELHRANMDIQFILDAYACCGYIINYINKSNRGVSLIMREAMEEIRDGNYSIKQKLQHIGNKFVNATEISAQEAAYNILGMHLSNASEAEVYINTSRPDKRVKLVKSRRKLERLEPESTDIYILSLIDHYVLRPDDLENLCLADFAATYQYYKTARPTDRHNQDEDEDDENDEEEEAHIGRRLRLKKNNGFVQQRMKPRIIRYRKFSADSEREDYFRELVMLYLPWRDEESELLQNNNEETCTRERATIEANRRKYNVLDESELERVLNEIRRGELEEDMEYAAMLQDDPEFDEEFRAMAIPEISQNVNVFEDNNATEDRNQDTEEDIRLIKLPPIIPQEELLEMTRTLNINQQLYLKHILHTQRTKAVTYEFVGGGAGVGKSRLISTIYQAVTRQALSEPGCDPITMKVLLCAPTGKAAFGIGGATLHSIFPLPVNQSSMELRPLSHDAVNTLYSKLIDLRLIIIDEISMVGARMLAQLDSRLKQVFKSSRPFGGIPMTVFGDLKQLSPVGDRWIFSPNRREAYSDITGTSLWDLFKYFELTEIMRQREDRDFAVALNNMSEGRMTEQDIALVRSRVVEPEEIPSTAIHLFWSNEAVSNYNAIKLGELSTEEFTSTAKDTIKASAVSSRRSTSILEAVQGFKVSETQGLPYQLLLKKSAKYMMTVNVNTMDGLVNGATGVLMDVIYHQRDGIKTPYLLWIHFGDPSVGAIARSKRSHSSSSDWTPVVPVVRRFQYKRNDQVSIERTQFPVIPAEAITIHKSQGATYQQVAVHLDPGMRRAALYVACSRATTASGLYLVGDFVPPKPITAMDLVQYELNKLKDTKKLKTAYEEIYSMEGSQLKVMYHNVQSLRLHFEDVRKDVIMCSADILCFVETWTLENEADNYDLPGFKIVHRIDSSNEEARRPSGIILYAKEGIINDIALAGQCNVEMDEHQVYQKVRFAYKDIGFLIFYRSPRYSAARFRRHILEDLDDMRNEYATNLVVMGDFNICRSTNNDTLEESLREKGLNSLLERTISTTNGSTQIDWIFSNQTGTATIYETLYSYHNAICFITPLDQH